jgi:hypothetical protein
MAQVNKHPVPWTDSWSIGNGRAILRPQSWRNASPRANIRVKPAPAVNNGVIERLWGGEASPTLSRVPRPPAQVQQRQHRRHLGATAAPARQQHVLEPPPLTHRRVHPPVVHPGARPRPNGLADDSLPEFFAWWDIITRSDTDQLEPVLHEVYQLDDQRLRRELIARARRHIQERSSLQVVGGQLRQCMTGTGAFHATR